MIGIDIISIKRFNKIKKSDYPHWDKFFTKDEWEHCFKKVGSAQSLAGIFAAKEAIIKSFGKKEINNPSQIEIKRKSTGQPFAQIKKLPKQEIQISISHDQGLAVAVALRK